jgi:Brp/Blh family beta-carotene 15,15'-monooxygenase
VGLAIMGYHFIDPIPLTLQIGIMLTVLFLMGIPHGALDFFIDRSFAEKSFSQLSAFLLRYLVNMAAYAVVWYFLPVLAILIFILLTAYHFGEIDWMGKVSSVKHRVIYFFLGFSWILFLLSVHIREAADIFVLMGNSQWDTSFYTELAGYILPISFASLWILHGIMMVNHSALYSSRREFVFSILQILILAIITVALPLWLCFAFYFGIWHSLLSFDMIRRDMNLGNDLKGWTLLIKRALPYAAAAWGGIILFITLRAQAGNLNELFHLLFIGIAVLALPHLQVFTRIKVSH